MARPLRRFTMHWPDGFDQFWAAYPLHLAKLDAQWAWTQARPDPALLTRMLDALEWQRRQPAWTRVDPAIPYAATWIRGRRFEDEPFTPAQEPDPTPAELRQAQQVRDKAWGGCRHEPRCESVQDCLAAIVYNSRATL